MSQQLDNKTRRVLLLIGGAVALVVIFFVQWLRSSSNIYYDIERLPLTVDPQMANDPVSATVVANTFEGLMRKDRRGYLEKGVCSDYSVSPNGLVYTFTIDTTAQWHDKTLVRPADFVFAFRRLLDPQTKSPTASLFSSIQGAEDFTSGKGDFSQVGVKDIGRNQVQFTLSQRDSMFLQKLTLPAAMPCQEEAFADAAGTYGTAGKKTLTNGAFYISNITPEESITIRKSKQYNTGATALADSVVFIETPREEREKRFRKGSTDLLFLEDIQREKDLPKRTQAFETKTWVLLFHANSDAFKNAVNRKAFLAGISEETLTQKLPYPYQKAETLFGQRIQLDNVPYAQLVGNTVKEFQLDPNERLLTLDSGTANELVLLTGAGKNAVDTATEITQSWQKHLSVFVKQQAVEEQTLLDLVQKGEFTFAIVPVSDFLSPELSSLYSISKSPVFPKVLKEKMDELRGEFLNSTNPADQKEVLLEVERSLYRNYYAYPLYTETSYFATSKKVKNIYYLPKDQVVYFKEAKK